MRILCFAIAFPPPLWHDEQVCSKTTLPFEISAAFAANGTVARIVAAAAIGPRNANMLDLLPSTVFLAVWCIHGAMIRNRLLELWIIFFYQTSGI